MNLRLRTLLLAAVGSVALVAGCQEQLTTPGTCPANCPGGTPVLRDTVLEALIGEDSTHSGYVVPGTAIAGLRVANGLNGTTNYAVIQFLPRDATLKADSTQHTYVIDSMVVQVSLLARDTSVSGLSLEIHRMALTPDSNPSFAAVDGVIVPGTLIDSITIADSIPDSLFTYRFVFPLDTTPNLQIPAADSGRLQVAVALLGGTPSGIRLGGILSGTGSPVFWTYVTVNTTDTTTAVRKQFIKRGAAWTRFVSNSVTPPADSSVLAIGTPTGSRAVIRFPWPAYLRDSALLARATLELVPEQPIAGLSGDSSHVEVYGVHADFGAKSPRTEFFVGTRPLLLGSTDTVKVDVISELGHWQASRLPDPPVLVVNVSPEGTSFTEPRFYSTRQPVAERRPRLRITYQAPFDFERP
ncbi:MAG: hypothetical protein JF590_02855 [Gemmatimonadetes bacterium]|nr:hypothetical protein [Gemmatimonadota bacterium]